MEEQLRKEFQELQGVIKVKGWWFKSRAKQLLESSIPNNSFVYSDGWFSHFKSHYRISLRRSTNTAQCLPDEKEAAIQEFYQQIWECQLAHYHNIRKFGYPESGISNTREKGLRATQAVIN